jgi:hypothetical protein
VKCVCPAWSSPPRVFPPSSCYAHPRWRSSPAWMSLLPDALLALVQPRITRQALIDTLRRGVARAALRFALRCLLCLSLSGASVRGRADCAKKTASGLRGRPGLVDSYRLRASTISPHTHAAGVPDPVKECTNINTVQTGTCNLARPPVHHRPHSVAAVCARVHVLPSCTRSSPSQAACVHLAR